MVQRNHSYLNPSKYMNKKSIHKNPGLWTYFRAIASTMIILIGMQSVAPLAMAAPISSQSLMAESSRGQDLATIQLALENKVVEQRLQALGFTTGEIQERLAMASDAEIHQLAVKSETMQAGGAAGFVVAVLVVILLVMIIMRIAAVEAASDNMLA
jgi:hypothetical protein